MKKIFVIACALMFLFSSLSSSAIASAAEKSLTAYLFYGDGCPHCAKEEAFLETIKPKYPGLEIKSFEVYHDSRNASLLQSVADTLETKVSGVPFLIIGDEHIVGYTEGITSNKIESRIIECIETACPDSIASLIDAREEINNEEVVLQTARSEEEKLIRLPILGEINAVSFSLPILTIVMGVLDGFNPCAMWTLIFLIGLLLGMNNKKRMWLLGSAFIVASASVYFMFMSAWLNLILFLGFIVWIRLLIGLLALLGGGYSLKEFWSNKNSVCKITDHEQRKKVFQKIRSIIELRSFPLALGGMIILAFMVNLVELVCSAGLPAVYTQILSLNGLTTWQYYSYILLYIFFFMIDDLIVFAAAMITLQMTGISTKYARHSRLIGGLVMVVIGLLLIFKPQLLMFG